MFDAVLDKQPSRNGFRVGLIIAVLVYSGGLGLSFWTFSHSNRGKSAKPDLVVTLFTALNPPPPPPPPPAPAEASAPSKPVTPQRVAVQKPVKQRPVVPDEVKTPQVDEPETPQPEPAAAEAAAPAPSGGAGVAGGVAGGVPGGTVGGVPGGTGTQVLPFGAGMSRPVKLSGADPSYSPQAIAARVEGKVLVRCVITVGGSVEQCQVLKGVPLLTEIVLGALRETRFRPVEYLGHFQAIQYLFTYNFKLP